jgi:hypothetical protein
LYQEIPTHLLLFLLRLLSQASGENARISFREFCSQILDIKNLANVFSERRLKSIEFTLEKQRVPKFSQAIGSKKGQN